MLNRLPAVGLAALLLAGPPAVSVADAATQGSLASSSSGRLHLLVSIGRLILIRGLQRRPAGRLVGWRRWTGSTRHGGCTNSSQGAFALAAAGSDPSGSFRLTKGATQLPYEVIDDESSGAPAALISGTAPQHQVGIGIGGLGLLLCLSLGPENQNLSVRSADLSQASSVAYTGSLMFLVSPQ